MKLTLKIKAVLGALIFTTTLLISLQAVFSGVLMARFDELERQFVLQNMRRITQALESRSATISTRLLDWAAWDDTYAFLADKNQNYIDSNLVTEGIVGLETNFILIFNSDNQLFFHKSLNFRTATDTETPQELIKLFKDSPELLAPLDINSERHGLLIFDKQPLLFGMRPIITSARQGPSRGKLVWARLLDKTEEQELRKQLELNFEIELFQIANRNSKPDFPFSIANSDTTIQAYDVLFDFYGAPAIQIQLTQQREIWLKGLSANKTVLWLVLGVGTIAAITLICILNLTIIRRINRLLSALQSIRQTDDLSRRLPTESNDEITVLASEINQTLASLEEGQKQLIQAREIALSASQAKSRFVSTMSHEIRTPVNGILGMTELLEQCDLPAEAQEHLVTLKDCTESLLGVVNDVLDFAKIEAGKLELETIPFSMSDLERRVINTVKTKATQSGLSLEHTLKGDFSNQCLGDPTRLGQVLINLLSNSLKFTKNGKVALLIESLGNQYYRFEVSDTGIGMTTEQQARVFQAFSQADNTITRRFGGTGLGLNISKQIVEAMGGSLKLESALGKGSRFFFEVKIARYQRQTQGEHQPSAIKNARPLKVLVIDDVATNRTIAASHLKNLGHSFVGAASGSAAIEILKTSENFDLIITDLHMPEQSGIDLAQAIRQQNFFGRIKIPIIAFTADHDRAEIGRMANGAFDGFLTKPFRLEDVAAIVGTANPLLGVTKPTPTYSDIWPQFPDEFSKAALLEEFGDLPTVIEVLTCCLEETPPFLEQLKNAENLNNNQTLREAFHALKNSFINSKAERLRLLAEELEQHFKQSGTSTAVKEQLATFEVLAQQALNNLDKWLSQQSTHSDQPTEICKERRL